jgi:hypothetical protein
MNGELAQLVTLVTYGNFFLNEKDVDLSTNSTFQYISSLKFSRYKNNKETLGILVAGGVTEWFEFLRANHVSRLWNVAFAWDRPDLPEHIAVGFAGGVPRAIQADMPGGYELWYPLWETGGPKEKPWNVTYRGLLFAYSHVMPPLPMELVKLKLRDAIAEAEAFSRRPEVDADQWADIFEKSLQLLDSQNPVPPYHTDILPEDGFNLVSRQIMAAAMQAYVFGGMGSWNDMGFADKTLNGEYQKITADLYQAVNMSIVIASNSFLQK